MDLGGVMEEGSNGKAQLERYSSSSSYGGSHRHKPDRPPKYEKIHHDQVAQTGRYEKRQLVSDTVDKIYDRTQYEVDQLPSDVLHSDKYREDRTSVKGSRYDRLPRASLSKNIADTPYRDPMRDKYERLEKGKEAKESKRSSETERSSSKTTKPLPAKPPKPSAGELAILHGVCRCAAMGGRPHVHRSVDDKVSERIFFFFSLFPSPSLYFFPHV